MRVPPVFVVINKKILYGRRSPGASPGAVFPASGPASGSTSASGFWLSLPLLTSPLRFYTHLCTPLLKEIERDGPTVSVKEDKLNQAEIRRIFAEERQRSSDGRS